MRIEEGHLSAEGLRFGLVVSRFNDFLTSHLLTGALDALHRHGAREEDLLVVRVPGAFELPLAAKRLAERSDLDAVIALGAVIRGDTPHFDFIAAEVAKGLAAASLETGKPVLFGVLTTDTLEQAIERSGTKAGNKGAEAARNAIEMADLWRRLGS